MADFPSLEIFTDAYLADTGDLTLEEHGAYHLMLYTAWRRPDCALPNDMDSLKRALAAHCAKLHGRTFNALIPRLLHRFWHLDPSDGKWKQKRLQREREFRLKFSRNQSEIATKGWQKRRETAAQQSEINGLTDANPLPAGNAPHPTPPKEEVIRESYSSTPSTPSEKPNAHSGRGNGTGTGRPERFTIEDPRERMVRFQDKLAAALGANGYVIADAAANPKNPQHQRCLALCKVAAKRLNLGWPDNWHLLDPKARPP